MTETVLVNYWYAHNVGHAIEGLRYCLGYQVGDPGRRVSLLLNGATPFELAQCCPFIGEVYAVNYTSFAERCGNAKAALWGVPRTWDWVVDNHRESHESHQKFEGFRELFDAAADYFQPRLGRTWTGDEPPAYRPHQRLSLNLPDEARAAARSVVRDRPAIAVTLAGSAASSQVYPSVTSWQLILSAVSHRYPERAICLIGKLAEDGRTTSRLRRETVDRLIGVVPAAVDCFDRPLLEQLAIIELSSLFLAPHTGLGFAALAVGTPWLSLSGGHWHEYFFNSVPFYCVLPDTRRYPCFTGGAPLPTIAADEDGDGPRTPSMSAARIREDLPELLHAAELLMAERLPYEQALAEYFPRLVAAYDGDAERVWSFDGIHFDYV